jgi:hypothetical protein
VLVGGGVPVDGRGDPLVHRRGGEPGGAELVDEPEAGADVQVVAARLSREQAGNEREDMAGGRLGVDEIPGHDGVTCRSAAR